MTPRSLAALIAAPALLVLLPLAAAAAETAMPPCDSDAVVGRIANRFNWAERNTFHKGVTIDTVDQRRESRLDVAGPSVIDKRYCRGQATMSDGSKKRVYYVIETGGTLTGCGWNVFWCVDGHDPYHVNDGWCRVVRPQ
ncbi:MAG TPA: hypothetical protein PLJ34_10680 [Hyphomicrobiales bacterium]|nr:hypothetical protein [Hyphomicrobiales bacterium]